ncbi:hypothetical protein WG899_05115 [Paucibacter sp. AS339]|uniref:hypothetical protein n=1 Tax=Paucibacter hankyongi TaxID=3133434 RepID=UPI00309C322D
MGTTYRYLASPTEPSEVMAWFRSLPRAPKELKAERGTVVHFEECGPLVYGPGGRLDAKASPVATILHPRIRRGALWTAGEVHFLASPLRQRYPALHKTSKAFSNWLTGHRCVHSQDKADDQFAYYLEGSIRNYDSPVFALDSGLTALEAQRYFVAEDDTESRLESICRYLRLRGVECSDA